MLLGSSQRAFSKSSKWLLLYLGFNPLKATKGTGHYTHFRGTLLTSGGFILGQSRFLWQNPVLTHPYAEGMNLCWEVFSVWVVDKGQAVWTRMTFWGDLPSWLPLCTVGRYNRHLDVSFPNLCLLSCDQSILELPHHFSPFLTNETVTEWWWAELAWLSHCEGAQKIRSLISKCCLWIRLFNGQNNERTLYITYPKWRYWCPEKPVSMEKKILVTATVSLCSNTVRLKSAITLFLFGLSQVITLLWHLSDLKITVWYVHVSPITK